jgi:hypothetical protein
VPLKTAGGFVLPLNLCSRESSNAILPEKNLRKEVSLMAKRAYAKTIEVKSSRVAYISHPKETTKLIEEAATSAPVN